MTNHFSCPSKCLRLCWLARQCDPPTPPDNGNARADPPNFLSSAVFTCNSGYQLSVTTPGAVTCRVQDGGTMGWTGTAPTCNGESHMLAKH